MRTFLRCLLRLLYGFRSFNEAVLATPGPVLLLPNHVSWWDWLLIGVCLEDDWRFVTSSTTAATSWLHRRIMVNRRTFPVDMNSPYAVKHIAEYLRGGGRLVLFPEGRLSCTGSLMKIFDGTGFLVFKTHARVITAYLRGANRLPFSPNPNRKKWFPRLSAHFSTIQAPPELQHLSVTESRARLTEWLRQRMLVQRFEAEMEFGPTTLPEAINQRARERPGQTILQDSTMTRLTYRRLRIGADLLAAQWRKRFGDGEQRIGVLLPNVNAMPVVLLSLWAANKVPAVLNYTTGPATLSACARVAGLRQVITSRTFVARSKLDLEPLRASGIALVFLEDVRAEITRGEKFFAAWRGFFNLQPATCNLQPDRAAAILFTSGSEGEPKAVELSHRNLLANIRQMLAVIDLMDTDRFFNALPLFHSFGLTVGLLLPLVEGVYVFLHLSPLQYRVVPSALYNLDCTIFFGTNTFLAGYARKAHPFDFRAVRYLFAGAEKLQGSTSAVWANKFGVRILEGYGATECSPCLSVNQPMHPCPGSTGQFLPGIEYRLEPVEGVTGHGKSEVRNPKSETNPKAEIQNRSHAAQSTDSNWQSAIGNRQSAPSSPATRHPSPPQAGRLFVRGPNVMRGYLNPDANARFQALGGWYDTGDIVSVDDQGFVHILGRLKRFAKVSGEMVSLTAVEDALAAALAHFGLRFAIAIITQPDAARGEKLVAVTNEPKLTLDEIRDAIRSQGLSSLAVPRELRLLREIPRLSTGKVNHRELERMMRGA